ncbi:MAG: hypothetical protein PVJ86_08360, partial [Phycisphaerales bacterium]
MQSAFAIVQHISNCSGTPVDRLISPKCCITREFRGWYAGPKGGASGLGKRDSPRKLSLSKT